MFGSGRAEGIMLKPMGLGGPPPKLGEGADPPRNFTTPDATLRMLKPLLPAPSRLSHPELTPHPRLPYPRLACMPKPSSSADLLTSVLWAT